MIMVLSVGKVLLPLGVDGWAIRARLIGIRLGATRFKRYTCYGRHGEVRATRFMGEMVR